MRVAIFGGTGFVGRYLIDELLSAGMHPVLLVRPGSENRVERRDACTLIVGDVSQPQAVEQTVDEADAAIYNIGILREFPKRGITYDALHFEGAKAAMDAAVAAGANRFLLMSANGVRADGSAYQRSKYAAEQYLETTDLQWTIFRPSVIFGAPHGRQEFASQLLHDLVNPPLPAPLFYEGVWPVKAGAFEMSPVHVEDVARAFVDALKLPETAGKVLPLGGPTAVSWREIIATIASAVGKTKMTVPVPAYGVYAAAAMLDHLPAFPITRDQLKMLLEGNVCTPDALESLGITPRPFSAVTLAYLKN
jgi:NADH dehydrogenase